MHQRYSISYDVNYCLVEFFMHTDIISSTQNRSAVVLSHDFISILLDHDAKTMKQDHHNTVDWRPTVEEALYSTSYSSSSKKVEVY